MKHKVVVNSEYCKGCGYCIAFCQRSVLSTSAVHNSQGYYPATPTAIDQCNGCLSCTRMCPDVAITVIREVAS